MPLITIDGSSFLNLALECSRLRVWRLEGEPLIVLPTAFVSREDFYPALSNNPF